MVDPLTALFEGRTSRDLVDAGQPVASHGPLERLPAFFRTGLLQDAGHLCRNFTGSVQIANGNASAGGQIPLGRASAATLLDLGLTVAFDALERHVPDAVPWARSLEQALGAPPETVRLMGFANAPGSGLTLHHDVHDQLLIHLQGTKALQWRPNDHLRNPSDRFSHGTRPARSFGANYQQGFPPTADHVLAEGMQTVTLQPGTVLFVPGGTWHTTAGQSEQTLSVAVIVEAPSRNEVLLNWLAWHLRQSREGRVRAYGGWSDDPTQATQGLRDTLHALVDRLPDPELAFATWQLDRSFGAFEHYPATAPFQRFIRLPFAELSVRPIEGGLMLRVRCGGPTAVHADSAMTTMSASGPVLDWIAACHRAFDVAELVAAFPEVDEAELRTLLAALGQALYLRPLPTPPWA